MKANDKAIEALADVLQHHGVFHGWFPKGLPADWRQLDPIGRREFLDIAGRLADAAYAAQFPPSEEYAGLVERLRQRGGWTSDKVWESEPDCHEAADALEAVLAERKSLTAAVLLSQRHNEILTGDINRLRAERDAWIEATDLPGINGIEFSDTMADDSKMELHLTVGQFRALQAARRKARGE